MSDGVRRVQAPLLVLGAVGVFALGFVSHARNRLLSGKPVGLIETAGLAGPVPTVALAIALLLLLVPLVWRDRDVPRWCGLFAAGGVVAAATWLAGSAATTLAASSATLSARTSLGAGFWVVVTVALLMASDTARRLKLPATGALGAGLVALGPVAALLASGEAGALSLLREYAAQREQFSAALIRHIVIVVVALVPTVLIGLPLGVLAQRRAEVRRSVFPVLNIIQTIPSIALFGLLIGPLSGLAAMFPALGDVGIGGIGLAPAVIALVLYSLLPIVRNTVEGLDSVPLHVTEAAAGMGMTRGNSFWRVQVPLAAPVLLSGLRVTSVQAVGLAAVSALIGAGGLGAIMFQGLFANALDLVLLGALPVILLSVAVDMAFRVAASLLRVEGSGG